MKRPQQAAANVVIGRTPSGEVLSSFKSANGRIVRVLDQAVYKKASSLAGKTLREAAPKKK
jgi:hypothetical protein